MTSHASPRSSSSTRPDTQGVPPTNTISCLDSSSHNPGPKSPSSVTDLIDSPVSVITGGSLQRVIDDLIAANDGFATALSFPTPVDALYAWDWDHVFGPLYDNVVDTTVPMPHRAEQGPQIIPPSPSKLGGKRRRSEDDQSLSGTEKRQRKDLAVVEEDGRLYYVISDDESDDEVGQ